MLPVTEAMKEFQFASLAKHPRLYFVQTNTPPHFYKHLTAILLFSNKCKFLGRYDRRISGPLISRSPLS